MSRNDFVGCRGLTIKQPFASLIAAGIKVVEMRGWTSAYRGDVLIQASAMPHPLVGMAKQQYPGVEFPLGMVLAVARVADIVPIAGITDKLTELDTLVAGDFKFAWLLEDVRRIDPFPLKGQLGLWTLKGEPDAADHS